VETQGNALAVGLLAGDTLNVDNVFETVDGGDLALTALVGTTDNGDLVILADGDAADLLRDFSNRSLELDMQQYFVRCTSHAAPC
jgi:hypothetical protein